MISDNLVERLAGVEINFSEERSEMTPIQSVSLLFQNLMNHFTLFPRLI